MKYHIFSSPLEPKLHQNQTTMTKLSTILFTSLTLTTIFTFTILHPLNPSNHTLHSPLITTTTTHHQKEKECDIFKGNWVRDDGNGGFRYTNWSCGTIPMSKNCFGNGREDSDFVNWKWKPDKCELVRFDGYVFLRNVRGKKLAFVGDSVARNHFESLLCLLSQVETPVDAYKDSEDRNRIWYFPNHDFTLSILWTKFLVQGAERILNNSSSGIFDLHLDKIDQNWSNHLHTMDYAIVSTSHWFFRPIYLHKNSTIIGCVYCNDPNVTKYDVIEAIGISVRAALEHINECRKCDKLVTLLRTFSPSHFENGSWNDGGRCEHRSPRVLDDVIEGYECELRSVQVKEVERIRVLNGKVKFRVLDVTRAMLMRHDGHPGAFWGNKWMKGYNDCVHWCLPGPIDIWNDFLMAVLTGKFY